MKLIFLFGLVVLVGIVGYLIYKRANSNPNSRIFFEIESTGVLQEVPTLVKATNMGFSTGTGPIHLKAIEATASGTKFLTQETLISQGGKANALIFSLNSKLAQVFVIDAKNLKQPEWSEWQTASYFEDQETAAWNFMDKNESRRVATDPSALQIKLRFRIEQFNLNNEFTSEMARRKQVTKEAMDAYRAEFAGGNYKNICRLAALDPLLTKEQFLACKLTIESEIKTEEKWKLLGLFVSDGFVSWYKDEIENTPVGKRDWSYKKINIPDEEQLWFLNSFFETWLQINSADFIKDMPNVRRCIDEMGRVQKWNSESYAYVRKNIYALVQKKISQMEPSSLTEDVTQEISYLKESIDGLASN